MDLCPMTFKSFIVHWSAKIAGCWPQLKPLREQIGFHCLLAEIEYIPQAVLNKMKDESTTHNIFRIQDDHTFHVDFIVLLS